jgi:hypothetical protein
MAPSNLLATLAMQAAIFLWSSATPGSPLSTWLNQLPGLGQWRLHGLFAEYQQDLRKKEPTHGSRHQDTANHQCRPGSGL